MNIYVDIAIRLITFDKNMNTNGCNDIDHRTLVTSLIKINLLKIDINCDDIQLDNNSQMINPGGSLPWTLQWLGVKILPKPSINEETLKLLVNSVSKYKFGKIETNFIKNIFAYNINKKYQKMNYKFDESDSCKIQIKNFIKYIGNMDENKMMGIKNINELYQLLTDYFKIVLDNVIQKFADTPYFLKLSTKSVYWNNNIIKQTIRAMAEINNYKHLSDLITNYNTPHILAYYYSKKCSLDESKKIDLFRIKYNNKKDNRVINTTVGKYFQKNVSDRIQRGQSKVVGYNLLFTELLNNNISLLTFIKQENEKPDYINNLKKILLQIVYTLNVLSQSNFVHGDLHQDNIQIEKCDTPYTYFYIITDSHTNISHVVKIVSEYNVKIIDFDASFFNNSIEEESNNQYKNHIVTHIKNNYNDLSKFDLFYFFKVIERFITDKDIQTNVIKPIIYPSDKSAGYYNSFDLPCRNDANVWAIPPYIFKAMLKNCLTPYQTMMHLLNLDPTFYIDTGITIYNSITHVEITPDCKIFYFYNANIKMLQDTLYQYNDSWKKIHSAKLFKICPSLVLPIISDKIITAQIMHIVTKNIGEYDYNMSGGDYYYKYHKYKLKYNNLLQDIK